jgi:hypothetical protein
VSSSSSSESDVDAPITSSPLVSLPIMTYMTPGTGTALMATRSARHSSSWQQAHSRIFNSPHPDTRTLPAEASGRIRIGDALVSVNGHSLLGRELGLVVRLLKIAARAPGQAVNLSLRRARPNSACWECTQCHTLNVQEDVSMLPEQDDTSVSGLRWRTVAERLPKGCRCLKCGTIIT